MKDPNTIMVEAIYCHKKRKLLRAIDKGADVNSRDEDGTTTLMHALLAENVDRKIVELLVEKGVDINARDPKQGWTALHLAARDGHSDIVRFLLENGAEVDARDIFGNTPLGKAVMNYKGNNEVIHLLLAHGADKKIGNNEGVSPMSLAQTIGDPTLIDALKG